LVEDHRRWKVIYSEVRAKPLAGESGAKLPDDIFCKYMLLQGLKNDTVIFVFIQVFNIKWKKNQFGGRKVVGQAPICLPIGHKRGHPIETDAMTRDEINIILTIKYCDIN